MAGAKFPVTIHARIFSSYRTRIVQFYSRRIGDMQWGAKVNGKVGKWRVNGLASQTDSETVTSSAGTGAVYSAFRLSREIGGASNVGVIGANRTFDGTSEGSVGLVGTLFFSDYLGMTSQVIRSYGAHDEGHGRTSSGPPTTPRPVISTSATPTSGRTSGRT